MEAKRRALDEIAVRQCAADEKRKEEAERREEGLVVSQPAIIQSRELTSPTGAAQGASAIRTAFEALPSAVTTTSTSPKPRSAAPSETLTWSRPGYEHCAPE
jgi:hypothetical protein